VTATPGFKRPRPSGVENDHVWCGKRHLVWKKNYKKNYGKFCGKKIDVSVSMFLKYTLMNTVTESFNTTVRQMTKISQHKMTELS